MFVLFISLIFNEIIEINCFGLSKNTRRNIVDRAQNEDLIIKKIPSLESIEDKGYLIEFKEKEECESTKIKTNKIECINIIFEYLNYYTVCIIRINNYKKNNNFIIF